MQAMLFLCSIAVCIDMIQAELSPCIEDLNIDTSTDKLLEEALYCSK